MSEIAIIGAGAWGTALAIHAARAGRSVTLWARSPEAFADGVSARLPGARLPGAVRVTRDFPARADAVLLAIPMQFFLTVMAALPTKGALVACTKGVETGSLLLPLELVARRWPGRPAAVLTGPNFAAGIAAGQPAAAVVASTDPATRALVAGLLATPSFRLYENDDPIGAQLGGAAKNVIAIAAGVVIGAGLGENARAALVTRGLAEIARLVAALGGRAETVMGLSGLGDLLLTCTGAGSRNFSLGVALGRGERLADILDAREAVTEGVTTAPALLARAGAMVDLPICAAVSDLLAGRATIAEASAGLLGRPRRNE